MSVRHHLRSVLLAAVLAIVAAVYLPTSFFIVGEYNVAFACIAAVTPAAVPPSSASTASSSRTVVCCKASVTARL